MTTRGTKYWSSGAIPLIAPELLGDIIATSSDIAMVVSDVGDVLSVLINPVHRSFGRLEHWEGRNVRDFLTAESIPKFDAQISKAVSGNGEAKAVELNHADAAHWEFPVRYSFHRIGPDGAVLMLGRDLRPVAEMQQQLVRAQIALERDYETQREFDTRFRVLMNATRDAILFVSMSSGRITDVNAVAAKILGAAAEDLIGSAFAQEFEGRRRGEFLESLTNSAISDSHIPVELQARRSKAHISVSPTVFRAAGERLLLCRIEPSDDGGTVTDALSESLSALYQEGVDAILFTDQDGIIRSANESFLNLADVSHLSAVKGKSLADFLVRGSVDMKVLMDNAARTGHMRLYATKLASEYGSQVSVEISATYLSDKTSPSFVFVIRDASRVDAVRKPSGGSVDGSSVRSVMELVGSATLKDIVAETTDVVEKMCIETAVELTRNNRVAAAEMLGLSRQSLYVKLRKYGLLSKDGDS